MSEHTTDVPSGNSATHDSDESGDDEPTPLEARVESLEAEVADLEAAVQAVRGYVGNVRSVNQDVEQRADAALARAESVAEAVGADDDPGRESASRTPDSDAADEVLADGTITATQTSPDAASQRESNRTSASRGRATRPREAEAAEVAADPPERDTARNARSSRGPDDREIATLRSSARQRDTFRDAGPEDTAPEPETSSARAVLEKLTGS